MLGLCFFLSPLDVQGNYSLRTSMRSSLNNTIRSTNPCLFVRKAAPTCRHVLFAVVAVCICWHLPAQCQEQGKLSTDPQKRIDELPAVVAKLPESQDRVLAALGDEDLTVRYETLKTLTNQEHLPQAIRASVTRLIASQDSQTRILAIGCLGHSRIADRAEIVAITNALTDPVATVRMAAVQATPMVEVSAKCTIENLLVTLEDSDSSVQLSAAKILQEIKCNQSVAVPVLARNSENSPSSQVRTAALEALGQLTANIDETTDLLLRLALREKDADVRREAVRTLQNVQSLTPEQTSSLAPLIHDSSSSVRQSAAYTFVIVGRNDPHAVEMVARLQDDGDEGVRDAVAMAIRYGRAEKPFFSLIAKSLSDRSMEVKLDAATSLLKLRGEEDNLADDDPGPDIFLRPSPEGIWPKDLEDASLQALNQSESASLRELIADAIRRFGESDESLVKRLSELATSDSDKWVRRASVRAISTVKTSTGTLAALIAATRDTHTIVRRRAVIGLGMLSRYAWPLSEPRQAAAVLTDVEAALAAGLDDKDPDVRLAAFHALDRLRSEIGFSPRSTWPKLATTKIRVLDGLKSEDPDIREAAAKTLGSLQLSEADIEALLTSLRDENLKVGVQAAQSLASIDFFNDRVKQSVGLMAITFWDFTTPEVVIETTTRDLNTVAPKCHVIDALMSSLAVFQSSQLRSESMQSLAAIAARANSMVQALQEGDAPPNREFIKAASAAVDACAPSIQKAEDFVAKQLDDSDPHIRAIAATAAGSLQLQSADIAIAMDRLFRDANREVRKAAVVALPDTVAKDDVDGIRAAASKLVAAAMDSDSDVRLAAVQSIIELRSVNTLAQAFQNQDPEVRRAVLRGYTTQRTPTSDIEPTLKEGLKDPDRLVRLEALSYLNTMGNSAYALLKDVVPLLSDNSAEIRAAAASLFGYYRANAAFAVGDLQRLLEDGDKTVESSAAESLGWIGPPARKGVTGLISLLADEVVGAHSKLALQQIGDAAIPQLTTTAQGSADKKQAQLAAEVLEAIKASQSQRLFRVTLKGSNEHSINLQSSVVFAVATWCPFSQRLRDFLVRDDVKPYFNGISLYFLLEDETSTVEAHVEDELKGRKDWTVQQKSEVLDQVRVKVAAVSYFDESFLTTLPGEHLQVMSLSTLAVHGFPSVLKPSSTAGSARDLTNESWLSIHDWANSDWFSDHIDMPEALRSELSSISGGSLLGFLK